MHQHQHPYKILKSSLQILLPILHNYISNEYEDELEEYLFHGEYDLVYECFCETIAFYKIPISQETFDIISKLGRLMNRDEKEWMILKDFINQGQV